MGFELSQEHLQLQQSVKNYVEETILPKISTYEEKSILPLDIFRKLGEKGYLRAHIPKEHGGWVSGVRCQVSGVRKQSKEVRGQRI